MRMPPLLRRSGLAALTLLAAAPSAGAESLTDALATVYRTNPTIRAERARLRATSELKAQAWASALPQISADGSYSKLKNTQTRNPTVFGGGGTETVDLIPVTAAIDGSVPIFTGFRNINAIRQARARVRAGGAELVAVEQSVLEAAARAYFDVLRDITIYESNRNNVEVLLRQQEEAALRFKVGEVTRTDVAQADARLAQSRAGLAAAQATLAATRARYEELVGSAPGTLEPAPPLPAIPDTLDAAKELARAYAPAVVAARERESASRRQVAIAKGAFLPSVSLAAGYQYADEPSTFVSSDEQFSYGVRASVPLFTGGLTLSRVREARALRDSAEFSVDEAERRAEAAVASAWERVVAAKITIASAASQLEANELALEGVRREAQYGTRSTLDVLNAEQEYLDSRVSLANALRDERVAVFALLAAAGVLNPEAVGVAE